MHDSHTIFRKTADDKRQITVHLLNKGATITGISLSGIGVYSQSDVVLSYPSADEFDSDPYYLGATLGPVANRLKDGCFDLLNDNHAVDINEPDRSNVLHGGTHGLHQQTFQASPTRADNAVVFSLALPHLADGFPGDRLITVRYELLEDLSLQFDFAASTDRTTVMNLANHAYFNLGGPLSEHELTLNAEHYTPVDDRLIPTGEIAPLKGSALDYSDWKALGDTAIDHNFVLPEDGKLRRAASLRLRATQLQLDVVTTQPALQVYTGDGLTTPFTPRSGICLEAQGFPDAPNQPIFPNIVLEPGATYRQRTIYRFKEIAAD
jgi:aldose 1-epimerase